MKPPLGVARTWIGLALVALGLEAYGIATNHATVAGDLIRYDPGRLIVIRGADDREAVYSLSPGVILPKDLRVGRRVTLYIEPGRRGGTPLVSRVTTTSLTSEGNVRRSAEETRALAGRASSGRSATIMTSISGRVHAYDVGKGVTVTRGDGSQVSYLINDKSKVPGDLSIGNTIQVVPLFTNGPAGPFVQTISYVTVKLSR